MNDLFACPLARQRRALDAGEVWTTMARKRLYEANAAALAALMLLMESA